MVLTDGAAGAGGRHGRAGAVGRDAGGGLRAADARALQHVAAAAPRQLRRPRGRRRLQEELQPEPLW